MSRKEIVAIIGASQKPDRYAHKAFKMLREYGHETLLVSPNIHEVEGVPVVRSVKEFTKPVDTVTMYINAERSNTIANEIIELRPKRVIFNPGSENPKLADELEKAGIRAQEACTLVLLRTNQFLKD